MKPNTTVAIARVSVTTVTCMKGTNAVIPVFAHPGKYWPTLEYMHKFHRIHAKLYIAFFRKLSRDYCQC